jgi:hypothetical protein
MNVVIQSELKKFDAVVPAINQIKESYMPLSINGIEDEEGYEKVKEALKFMVTKRNEVEAKRKELKADSLALGKAIDQRAREISAMLEPIESHLRHQKESIDQEIKRIEEAKIAERQAQINQRIDKLMSINGMYQTITEFVWASKLGSEQISLLRINLEIFDEQQFEEFYDRVSAISNAEQEEIKAQEQQRILESQRLEEERKALEAQKAEIERQRLEIAKQVEEIQNQRASTRINALIELGLVNQDTYWGHPATERTLKFIPLVSEYEVKTLSDEHWYAVLEEIKDQAALFNDLEQRAKQEKEEAMRLKLVAELEAKRAEDDKLREAQRIADLAEIEKRERLDKKNKSEKKDAVNLLNYFKSVREQAIADKPNQLESEIGYKIFQDYIETIDKFIKRVQL